jgi:hypothetical protein
MPPIPVSSTTTSSNNNIPPPPGPGLGPIEAGPVAAGTVVGSITPPPGLGPIAAGPVAAGSVVGSITPPPVNLTLPPASCQDGFVRTNNVCEPIPYLQQSPNFILTCPTGYTLNTNPDNTFKCMKDVATFTSNENVESFSQNNNNKCKARY